MLRQSLESVLVAQQSYPELILNRTHPGEDLVKHARYPAARLKLEDNAIDHDLKGFKIADCHFQPLNAQSSACAYNQDIVPV